MHTVHPPPRFLLGTALLFWGAMTDRMLVAVILAMIVEAAHFTRLRWDFDENSHIRAWQITVMALAIGALLIWLDGERLTALPRLLSWLPPLLLPVQFTQSFSVKDSIPLHAFSFFARQRRDRNLRLGLSDPATPFNFGNVYLIATIIGSVLGKWSATPYFLIGLVFIVGWYLVSTRRSRMLPLALGLAAAGLLGRGGQLALDYAYDRYTSGGYSPSSPPPGGFNESRTAIGSLGEVKQNPAIVWRLTPREGDPAPLLLRTASFNNYTPKTATWVNNRPSDAANAELDFQDLTVLDRVPGETYTLLRDGAGREAFRPSLPRFTLRGGASNESPLPVPGNAASVAGFELDGIQRNSLGTVRIFPKASIINGTVLWNDSGNPEIPPRFTQDPRLSILDRLKASANGTASQEKSQDLRIPGSEKEVIAKIAEELDLAGQPSVHARLAVLRGWFAREFTYTRYLSTRPPQDNIDTAPTAISTFLTTNRRGHCEYFATSAILLLRQAGVPARYAIGYAVRERGTKAGEYLIRGTHGHAWCRVWDEKSANWIDFDPTPPDWLGTETQKATRTQWLLDRFLMMREDFFLWRNQPGNRLGASLVMSAIGIVAFVIIARRLWKSKKVLRPINESRSSAGSFRHTPLHDLGPLAEKHLGTRPPGLPFSRWLAGLRAELADPAELDEAIHLHQALRFDPAPPSPPPLPRLQELVDSLKKTIPPVNKQGPA